MKVQKGKVTPLAGGRPELQSGLIIVAPPLPMENPVDA